MKVRRMVVSVCTFFFILWILLIYSYYALVTKPNVDKLQMQKEWQSFYQMAEILTRDALSLYRLCADWSVWDDTYAFILNPGENQDYEESNLVLETYHSNNLSLIRYEGTDGEVVWQAMRQGEELIDPEEYQVPHTIRTQEYGGWGIFFLNDKPVIFGRTDILASDGSGETAGQIVMTQILDEEYISNWANISGIKISLHPTSSVQRGSRLGHDSIVLWDSPWAQNLNIQLRVELSRVVFKQMRGNIALLLIQFIFLGVLCFFLIILVLNRFIFTPLKDLLYFIGHYDDSEQVLSSIIPVERTDEIGVLAVNFRGLLDKVALDRRSLEEDIKRREEKERKLLKHKNSLEIKIENRIKEIEAKERVFQTAKMATIVGLAKLAEYRDEDTGHHLERIREYCRVIAESLKTREGFAGYITDDYILDLYHSSILHDIGKVGIPDSVLLKPGRLTSQEFEVMQKHVKLGGETLSLMDKRVHGQSFLTLAKDIAFFHHEKWDGSGYMLGLSGINIPLSARIIAIADVYDALTSKRTYKPAFSHQDALKIIYDDRGRHFDPVIVDCFLENEGIINRIRETYLQENGNAFL